MGFIRRYAGVLVALSFLVLVPAFLYFGTKTFSPARIAPVQANTSLPERRILFVGNSYTFFNDMPLMVQNMLNSSTGNRFNYRVDLIARGGAKLADHVSEGAVLARIESGRYDYVFLQEQSTAAFYSNEALVSEASFGSLINATKRRGARVALLSTWARKSGHEFYARPTNSNFASARDPAAMSRVLNNYYQRIAGRYGADHIQVGAYWLVVLSKHPEIDLYVQDGSHPTLAGSYLVSLMVYRYVAGAVTENTWRPASLNEADGRILIQLVSR